MTNVLTVVAAAAIVAIAAGLAGLALILVSHAYFERKSNYNESNRKNER